MTNEHQDAVSSPDQGRFAAMVRTAVGTRTSRMVQQRTGVSHSTVADMMNGYVPKPATIERFARGLGVDPTPLLEAAFSPDELRDYTNRAVGSEIVYDADHDSVPVPEGFRDLEPIDQEIALKQFAAVVDVLREARQRTGIGYGAGRRIRTVGKGEALSAEASNDDSPIGGGEA
jgi:transcriptional regulator with XRE-family HTH domain